jgi:hypothetical protein
MSGSLATMRLRHLSTSLIAALILVCGCHRDISGTYLATDSSDVALLQLVRTPDNHLTGQLALSVLKPDGKIDRNSVSITGAVNGENVSISGSGLFGLQSTALSGTLNGNTLTLTGPQAQPFVLKRSSLGDYHAQMSALDARSQTIIATKAAAQSQREAEQAAAFRQRQAEQTAQNLVSDINRLIGDMQRFESEADVHLGRFPNVEKGYQAITAKMSEYVTRERQVPLSQTASATRSQLYVNAMQASYGTDQMHYNQEALQTSLDSSIRPISEDLKTLEQRCKEGAPNGTTESQSEARDAACTRLQAAIPVLRQKYDAIVVGLAHLEQVYKQEKAAQQRLLESAEKMQ